MRVSSGCVAVKRSLDCVAAFGVTARRGASVGPGVYSRMFSAGVLKQANRNSLEPVLVITPAELPMLEPLEGPALPVVALPPGPRPRPLPPSASPVSEVPAESATALSDSM